jgi:hypothetical protein
MLFSILRQVRFHGGVIIGTLIKEPFARSDRWKLLIESLSKKSRYE